MDLYYRPTFYTMEDVYKILRNEILMFQLPPGCAISEKEMAQRFHLSRTPVRSAFGKLQSENLIRVVPQKGTYITLLDFDYILQLVYMREKVEHHILKEAIECQTAKFLDTLAQNLQMQKALVSKAAAVDQQAFFDLDGKFHQACYTLVGKEKLWNMLAHIDNQYIPYRILYYTVSRSFQILYQEHVKLYKLIVERKSHQVEQFCWNHLNGHAADVNNYVRKHYANFFAPSDEP